MMKFFRKYNKHLLAVFMALLLMIWLAGDAIQSVLAPDTANEVVAHSKFGVIKSGDIAKASHDGDLQDMFGPGFSWRQFIDHSAPSEDQFGISDWILLVREAEKFGIHVTPAQAKSVLDSVKFTEDEIRRRLARQNYPVADAYQAVAQFLTVQKMITLVDGALHVPDAPLRVLAHDVLERASIELVTLPAKSFADPEQTFTAEELKAQFDANKSRVAVPDSLEFGYYREPRVQLEVIKVDPRVVREQLRTSPESLERDAFLYWQKSGRTDPALFRPMEERAMLMAQAREASSNGAEAPDVKEYYENFADGKTRAIEALKDRKAKEEADSIAKTIVQRLQEPWFEAHQKENKYKIAPAAALTPEYFEKSFDALPANLRYENAVTYSKLEPMTASQLARQPGVGSATLMQADGRQLTAADIAFQTEGLGTIPEEGHVDLALYLTKFQPLNKWLTGPDDSLYLIRVIDVQAGHEPQSVDEVHDEVVHDLRILRGMDRAREAAKKFSETVGTSGLADAWKAATDLDAKVTPDKGGLSQLPPFVRGTKLFGGENTNRVAALGRVTDEFMAKSFELAADPKAPPVVVDMPSQAAVAVIKGKQLFPIYEEDFQAQRSLIQDSVQRSATRNALMRWLSPKQIRERCEYQPETGGKKKPAYHGPAEEPRGEPPV
jgi:hypothetical protein